MLKVCISFCCFCLQKIINDWFALIPYIKKRTSKYATNAISRALKKGASNFYAVLPSTGKMLKFLLQLSSYKGLQDYQAALKINPDDPKLQEDATKIREIIQGACVWDGAVTVGDSVTCELYLVSACFWRSAMMSLICK